MTHKKKTPFKIEEELFQRYPQLVVCKNSIELAYRMLVESYKKDGKLLIAGNGGSAADGDHISGELVKSFYFPHKLDPKLANSLKDKFGEEGIKLSRSIEDGLPAISLTNMIASNTAFSNDVEWGDSIAQLVHVMSKKEDIFLGITTSGNSENIIKALMVAKAKGIKSIVLTGKTGGKSIDIADLCICVPETETFKIQELHLPVYHSLCLMLESEMFEECD